MDLLKSISTFQLVVEYKSFSGAAQAMNLVPSAVSRQVSELEKWLGVRLLQRTTRSIGLTSEGRSYLAQMALISQSVAELKGAIPSSTELKGDLRITAPLILGKYVLPSVLSEFSNQHPEVNLSLFLTNRNVNLAEEGYDLALRVGNLPDSGLIARTLGEYRIKTLASPSYLERYGVILTPQELKDHRCLINNARHTPRRWLYQIDDNPIQVKVDGDIESNDSECLLEFCLQGQGIIQLPTFQVRHLIEKGELVELIPEYSAPPQQVSLLFTSNKLMGPVQRALIDFLVGFFHKNPVARGN
ncbi:transcriptional regulator, LysR family [Shewanella psychrophila]|uniref:Transcriptional regulator, LysR family n=1 Tax=Shewanella psychrophila TaxID=225848 RepID=A0A1S6HIR8_9GAMM|nr:LysR family transcriptional regulator [Shewanella psychrophila]AQS35412.1 transcriptional regulator, LysR family [Shewanella psychrophila]